MFILFFSNNSLFTSGSERSQVSQCNQGTDTVPTEAELERNLLAIFFIYTIRIPKAKEFLLFNVMHVEWKLDWEDFTELLYLDP